MRRSVFCLVAIVPLLQACETSSRFSPGSNPFGSSARAQPEAPPPASPPKIDIAPTARVESAPLAPPTGSGELPPPAAAPQIGSAGQVTTPSGSTPGSATTPPQVAVTTPPKAEPEQAATTSSVTGSWTAKEASGSCRVTLSSAPKLDLYGASTSGCQSKGLQRVTAWELRGDEVYLYEPGGSVAARLKARARSMDGTLAKTGAPITLSK